MIEILEDPTQWTCQKGVAEALGRIGDKRAILALRKTVLEAPFGVIRNSAGRALVKMNDKQIVAEVILQLRTGSVMVREHAAESLCVVGVLNIKQVEELLKDESEFVRKKAVEVIRTIKQRQEKLKEQQKLKKANQKSEIKDKDPKLSEDGVLIRTTIENKLIGSYLEEVQKAEKILVDIGKPAIPELAKAISGDNKFIENGTSYIVGQQARGAGFVSYSAATMRFRALEVIEKIIIKNEDIDDKSLVPTLILVGDIDLDNLAKSNRILELLSKKSKVKEEAVKALKRNEQGHISEQRIKRLISILENTKDDKAVISSVANAIGKIGPKAKAAVPILIKRVSENKYELLNNYKYREVNKEIAFALGRMDVSAVPLLKEALNNDQARVRAILVEALGSIKNNQVSPILIRALKDKDYSVRRSSAASLGKIGGKQALLALVEALDDETYFVRSTASESLDKLKWMPFSQKDKIAYLFAKGDWEGITKIGKPAIVVLLKGVKDKNNWCKVKSAKALYDIGDQRGLQTLIEMLKDYTGEGSGFVLDGWEDFSYIGKASGAKYAAVELGNIGDKLAIPALEQALKDAKERKYYYSSETESDVKNALEKIKKVQNQKPTTEKPKNKAKGFKLYSINPFAVGLLAWAGWEVVRISLEIFIGLGVVGVIAYLLYERYKTKKELLEKQEMFKDEANTQEIAKQSSVTPQRTDVPVNEKEIAQPNNELSTDNGGKEILEKDRKQKVMISGGGSGITFLDKVFNDKEWSIRKLITPYDSGGSTGVLAALLRKVWNIPSLATGDIGKQIVSKAPRERKEVLLYRFKS